MNLTGLSGNAHLRQRLQGPLAHAYILSGPPGAGKHTLAGIMARAKVCTGAGERPCNTCSSCEKALKGIHPDIQYTGREESGKGKRQEIVVAQIRQITTDAHTLPNEAEGKVYVIQDADAMNTNAQNAFLKMLEEPPSFCTFLLLAENPLALLPTVRSRCIHLQLVPPGEAGADEGEHLALADAFMAAFTDGGLALLEFCTGLERVDRPTLIRFIETCHLRLTEALKHGGPGGERVMAAIGLFDELRDDLRFNVSAGHISGRIAARLIEPPGT